MKNHLVFSILLFITTSFFSQEKQQQIITKKFSVSEKTKIDFTKVFDKKTNEKISEKEFYNLTKKNKNFSLEKIINPDGTIEKYLFTGNLENNITFRDITKRVNVGEPFPNFIIKTIQNKKIELAHLKGKVVLIRFELFANNFRFKKHEITDLDAKINEFGKDNFEAILIFTTPKDEVIKGFDLKNSNFNLVSDGMNFNERYKITRYPTTIIIDKKGNLIAYFKKSDEINFKEILNK